MALNPFLFAVLIRTIARPTGCVNANSYHKSAFDLKKHLADLVGKVP